MDLSTIFSILGILIVPAITYLLNKKDAAQEKDILALQETCRLLFKKHDDDAAALVLLQRQIDKEHYIKPELDARFQSLETTFRSGMHELGSKFDKLANTLLEHISRANSK